MSDELDERDVLFDNASTNDAIQFSDSESEDDTADGRVSSSRPHQLSSLQTVDEDAEACVNTAAPYESQDDSSTSSGRGSNPPSQSMPLKLGSSLPVNIPMQRHVKKSSSMSRRAKEVEYPATFVPPHTLVDAQWLALDGPDLLRNRELSLIKKDRLRARNDILKQIGFMEPTFHQSECVALQERKRLNPSELSKAFQEPQV